ncbi:class I SAM-dependent methyltransferase [Rhizorhabdus argentea]|uniref:class I SAM-dependent methyltransferase n=1 Tax=Rhizorhabdus argentea TaxID=1387174 RepID=UPI0030ED2A30
MTVPPRPAFDPEGAAQRLFERVACAARLDPSDRWVGGYADYEWDHLRLALRAYGVEAANRDVLEFGCNVGGSAVVLAALGARVTGIDIDPALVAIAGANLQRHRLAGAVRHVPAGQDLPLADASFDLVIANSVLEYVDPARLDAVLAELHRLLRPGGRLFICGTASRLALRERHSGRWLVNYLPRAVDRLTGRVLQRGLSPWLLMRGLRGRFCEEGGGNWLAARRAIHGGVPIAGKIYALLSKLTNCPPGLIAPYIELMLRKSESGGAVGTIHRQSKRPEMRQFLRWLCSRLQW